MTKREKFEDRIAQKIKQLENGIYEDIEMDNQEAQQKLQYLYSIQRQESLENKLRNPKVFVSFAGDAGNQFLTEVSREIGKLKTDSGERFQAFNGMRMKGDPFVLTHIVETIRQCCIFIGILTKEYKLNSSDDEEGSYAPGSWVLLEAGMAISLGLRVIFLVEEGIHKNFWLDPLGAWRHAKFKTDARQVGVNFVMHLIQTHYRELQNDSEYL